MTRVALLCRTSYTVSPDSDRIGLRLLGDPLPLATTDELPSEGMVLGAVQVPPDGRPVVFLADHPTTGGYPVVAVVDERDLWQCAQLRPGEAVGFTRARQGLSAGSSAVQGADRAGRGLGGLEPDGDDAAAGAPHPAPSEVVVDDVHAGPPGAGLGDLGERLDGLVRAASSSSSPNRSSWIQSASPDTPTPSRRTPPVVSSSPSSPRASRAIVGAESVGAASVVERDRVVKSWRRTLRVTVRPDSPLLAEPLRDVGGLAASPARPSGGGR